MCEKQIEETEKPFILVIGFFLHKTIAFSEGWLAPRYLTYYHSNLFYKKQDGISHKR